MSQKLVPPKGSVWRHRKYDPNAADPMNYTYKVVGCVFDTDQEIVKVEYEPLYVSDHLMDEGCVAYTRNLKDFLRKFTQARV